MKGLATAPRLRDELGVERHRLASSDLVAFHGGSGSGKTTAIARLLEAEPWGEGRNEAPVAVLDELASPREVARIWSLLRRGHRVVAGCHFRPAWLLPLRLAWRVTSVDLEALPGRIERWLDARGVAWSPAAIERFLRFFGSNYTDAAIVLEHSPGASFDEALERFLRRRRLEHGPLEATRTLRLVGGRHDDSR